MRYALIVVLVLSIWPEEAAAREPGTGRTRAVLDGTAITLFTYRPADCADPALLFVFHGDSRGAEGARDHARLLADRYCLLVYAPLFDRARFDRWRYHRGGIARKGRLRPPADWTVGLAAELVAWARHSEGRPDAPFYLFGHSAGGQFLSRVAAFAAPLGSQRIVIANPSSHVAPSLEEAAPYGFGKAFGPDAGRDRLRRYLSQPVTIYLGSEDTGREGLHGHPAARRQGANRLERGRRVFRAAEALARREGWAFEWRLVMAHDVAHSARDMLRSDAAGDALGR